MTDQNEPTPSAPEDAPTPEPEMIGMPRDKAVRLAQIGLLVLVLIVVGIVVLMKGGDDKGTDGSAKKTTEQDEDGGAKDKKADWPAEIGGRPPALGKRGQGASDVEVAADAQPGVYVWNDFDGWHLWVLNGEGVPAVSGSITSNDDIAKGEAAVDGAGTVELDAKTITFALPTDPALVGVDFNPGFFGKNLVISLQGPDGPIDQKLVHLGSKAGAAPSPLVIAKQ